MLLRVRVLRRVRVQHARDGDGGLQLEAHQVAGAGLRVRAPRGVRHRGVSGVAQEAARD